MGLSESWPAISPPALLQEYPSQLPACRHPHPKLQLNEARGMKERGKKSVLTKLMEFFNLTFTTSDLSRQNGYQCFPFRNTTMTTTSAKGDPFLFRSSPLSPSGSLSKSE
jgi:hypothetical protein